MKIVSVAWRFAVEQTDGGCACGEKLWRLSHHQRQKAYSSGEGDVLKKRLLEEDDVPQEMNFKHAIRNPYARLAQGAVRVELDEDLWVAFPDSTAVNAALRLVLEAGRRPADTAKAS